VNGDLFDLISHRVAIAVRVVFFGEKLLISLVLAKSEQRRGNCKRMPSLVAVGEEKRGQRSRWVVVRALGAPRGPDAPFCPAEGQIPPGDRVVARWWTSGAGWTYGLVKCDLI
jgi:hypothetical protein